MSKRLDKLTPVKECDVVRLYKAPFSGYILIAFGWWIKFYLYTKNGGYYMFSDRHYFDHPHFKLGPLIIRWRRHRA